MIKFKKKTIHLILTILILISISFTFFYLKSKKEYNLFVNDFQNSLSNQNFESSKYLLKETSNNIVLKSKGESDINKILEDYIDDLKQKFINDEINESSFRDILLKLQDLNTYNTKIDTLRINIPLLSKSKENFKKGLDYLNNKNYLEAFKSFSSIDSIYPNYEDALNYKKECTSSLKTEVLQKVDGYANSNQSEKALSLLYSSLDALSDDSDILAKIDELENVKLKNSSKNDENPVEDPNEPTKQSNSKYSKLSKDTINSFDLSSKTSKLVITNISEQKTYIYSGNTNNWNLEKEFICSTGLESEPTPLGTFAVENKAPWFFSEKYGQGGKYWVGFKGNYLFHSVPFDRNQKKVLDPTLGEPASHGCIRLSVEDSKWLFNNIPIGTKVLIY